MSVKITKAMLLAILMFGTSMVMFSPAVDAQAAVAYSIAFTDGQVNLDIENDVNYFSYVEILDTNR